MIDERQRYERAFEVFEMPEPAFDRMVDRRDRKRRRQRIAAGMLALVVAVAGIWTLLSAARPMTRTGRPSPTPSVTAARSEVRYHGMGLNYVIPPGWEKSSSSTWGLTLDRPDVPGPDGHLFVASQVWAPDGCIEGGRCPTTPAAIATWIRANTSVRTRPVEPTMVGAYPAIEVDAVARNGASRSVQLLMISENEGTQLDFDPSFAHGVAAVAPDSKVRFLLFSVDGPFRRTYVIAIAAPEERFESFLPQAMRVVSRMEFGVFDHRSHGA